MNYDEIPEVEAGGPWRIISEAEKRHFVHEKLCDVLSEQLGCPRSEIEDALELEARRFPSIDAAADNERKILGGTLAYLSTKEYCARQAAITEGAENGNI